MLVNIMAHKNAKSSGAAAAAWGQKFDAAGMQKRQGALYLSAALLIELAFVLGMLGSVTGAPAEDLISSLPGQPQVTFKQYGGYVDVTLDAERGGRALYYYFVEAEANADTKPLVLWLNGGPACSTVGNGGFTALGPFYVNGRSLSRNFNAWNRVSNLLFLDNPAGVGFSYSNISSDYETDDNKTALHNLAFLLEWFKKFPEYQGREVFITGESYAGHFVPQLAAAVVENNAQPGQDRIELKGIMVGNPGFGMNDVLSSQFTFLWSHGMISEATYNEIILTCRLDGFTGVTVNESDTCNLALNEAAAESAGVSAYDLNGPVDRFNVIADVCTQNGTAADTVNHDQNVESNTEFPCIREERDIYLNRPEVQLALHARMTNWTSCADTRVLNYNSSVLEPMVPLLKDLVNGGLRLWVFSGDQDAAVSLIGTRQYVDQIVNELQLISTKPYRPWFERQQVGGWTASWGNLTFATVRGAGHEAPRDQPTRSLQLVTSFLSGTSLPSNSTA